MRRQLTFDGGVSVAQTTFSDTHSAKRCARQTGVRFLANLHATATRIVLSGPVTGANHSIAIRPLVHPNTAHRRRTQHAVAASQYSYQLRARRQSFAVGTRGAQRQRHVIAHGRRGNIDVYKLISGIEIFTRCLHAVPGSVQADD